MMLATLDEGLWDCTDLVECRAAELRIPIGPWVTGKRSFLFLLPLASLVMLDRCP